MPSNRPKVDIFYKTYPRDEEWISYSLKSINKFASGFRQIVIISNIGHNYKPPSINLPIKYIELKVPTDNGGYPHGIDYWWQMGIKLTWDQYTDADEVVIVDSDQIFYDYFSPDSWRKDNKVMWLRRPWQEVGEAILWKQGADYFLGKETSFSHMCSPGFYLTRTALKLFRNYMKNRFNQTPDNYYIDLKHPHSSEFETFGAFLDEIKHNEYGFYHPQEVNWRPWPLKQYWSWGGITREVRNEMEQFLK